MALITLHRVSIQYGGPPVLDQIGLNIEPGERACVTGRNGEGKSTLLKVIAGIVEPDAGEIIRQPGLRVAYLSQDVPGDQPGTVLSVESLTATVSVSLFSRWVISTASPFFSCAVWV